MASVRIMFPIRAIEKDARVPNAHRAGSRCHYVARFSRFAGSRALPLLHGMYEGRISSTKVRKPDHYSHTAMKRSKQLKYALYRMQQQIALTRGEIRAFTVVLVLLILGTIVRSLPLYEHVGDASIYAYTDSLFEAATRRQAALADSLLLAAELDSPRTALNRLALQTRVLLAGELVNINLASHQELEQLPRIGPAMAQRIIAYREQHGSFRSVHELVQVKGIGEKTLARLIDHVTVD